MGGSNLDSPSKRSGIYQIRNTVNGKRYIGSAAQFGERWSMHRYQLRRGVHHSCIMQSAWNKYGEPIFAFEILEIVENRRILLAREQFYLDTLHPEYNTSLTAGSRIGLVNSETHRARIKSGLATPEAQARLAKRPQSLSKSDQTREKMADAARKRDPATQRRGHTLPPEQREAMNAGRNAKIACGWNPGPAVITGEMREAGRSAAAAYHASLTPEQKAERGRRIREGQARARAAKKKT